MFINKSIVKFLVLILLFISVNLSGIPIDFWLGQKDGKFTILIEDADTAQPKESDEYAKQLYNIDKTEAVPLLTKFITELSKIKQPSELNIFNYSDKNIVNKINSDFNAKDDMYKMRDSFNNLVKLSAIKKLNNLKFKFINNDFGYQDPVSFTFFLLHHDPGIKIGDPELFNPEKPYGFVEAYINFLKSVVNEISKSFAETELNKNTKAKLFFETKYNEIIKLLSEFENNDLLKFLNAQFPGKKIKTGVFLKFLDILSARSEINKNDIAYNHVKELTNNKPDSLIKKLRNQKIDWLNIFDMTNRLNINLEQIYRIEKYARSLDNNNIVITYSTLAIHKELMEFIKEIGFRKVFHKEMPFPNISSLQESFENIIKFVSSEQPLFPTEHKETEATAVETIQTDLSKQTQIKKIANEIRLNHPVIQKVIDNANLTVEKIIENQDVNRYAIPLTKNKMTLLMLAANEIPGSPKLIQMLLDLDFYYKDVPIPRTEINLKEIPNLIGFNSLNLAQAALNMTQDEYSRSLSQDVVNRLTKEKLINNLDDALQEHVILTTKKSECASCGRKDVKLRACKKCKVTQYCSLACYTSGVAAHTSFCKKNEDAITQNKNKIKNLKEELDKVKNSIKPIELPMREIAGKRIRSAMAPKVEQVAIPAKRKKKKKKTISTATQTTAFKVSDFPEQEEPGEENIVVAQPLSTEVAIETPATEPEESKLESFAEIESKDEAEKPWTQVERIQRTKGAHKEPVRPLGKGSTGRRTPRQENFINESLAMAQVMTNPEAGQILGTVLNDRRWPADQGWVKLKQIIRIGGTDIEIHYVANGYGRGQEPDSWDDFKFKD